MSEKSTESLPAKVSASLLNKRNVTFLVLLLVILAVILSGPLYLPSTMVLPLALALFCLGLWGTNVVPPHIASLLFFLLAILGKMAPPQVIFGGFHSTSLWMIFGGLALGLAIQHTGLGQRIALSLARSMGKSYSGVICGMMVVTLILGFIMPSATGRGLLIIPIAMSLADTLGYHEGSKGRLGLLLTAALGALAPSFAILPSNVPNMVLAGAAEAIHKVTFTYMEYLILHFPILGLVKAVVIVLLLLALFPSADPDTTALQNQKTTPMSREEKTLLIVLLSCLTLWLSDAWHHISPAWVSMAAGIYCLWPGTGMTRPDAFARGVNFSSLFFLAGIMGLGALIGHSGIGSYLIHALQAVLPFAQDDPLRNVALLAGVTNVLSTLTSLPGIPAVMTPLAGELAEATNLPLMSVLMAQVMGFSTMPFLFQAPALVVGLQVGRVPMNVAAKVVFLLFLLTAFLLTPLNLLWWRILGWA